MLARSDLPDDIKVDAWTVVRESDFRRQVEHIVKEFTVVLEIRIVNAEFHPPWTISFLDVFRVTSSP